MVDIFEKDAGQERKTIQNYNDNGTNDNVMQRQ